MSFSLGCPTDVLRGTSPATHAHRDASVWRSRSPLFFFFIFFVFVGFAFILSHPPSLVPRLFGFCFTQDCLGFLFLLVAVFHYTAGCQWMVEGSGVRLVA